MASFRARRRRCLWHVVRRIYAKPDEPISVIPFANQLLDQPHCQVIEPGPRHWHIFCALCRDSSVRGNLVQDAWFAALAIESGCEWITDDRDYARFEGLRWRQPLLQNRDSGVR